LCLAAFKGISVKELNNFFIIVNNEKDKNYDRTKAIVQFLELRGKTASYIGIDRIYDSIEKKNAIRDMVPPNTDVIIVLGGDGTFIEVAGILTHEDIPLLGVNMGHLGYITETTNDNIFRTLEKIFRGEYEIEDRMMLKGEIALSDVKLSHFHALNDVVITCKSDFRILEFKVSVNNIPLYTCSADGMIVSTPTGSTAYNISCGGPIVAPYSKALILTPISAHSLTVRPLVLSQDDEVTIEITDSRGYTSSGVKVYFDGDDSSPLNVGDKVTVKKSNYTTKIVKLGSDSFFDVLSKKMGDR